MYKFFTGILFILFSVSSLSGQNFEGVIETKQVSGDGITHNVTWYVKKDKIAFEIISKSQKGELKMRFVPQPAQNSMLMVISTPEGETKNEITPKEITAEIDMSNCSIKELGTKRIDEYGEILLLQFTSLNSITDAEILKNIDVDLSRFATFLKNDYAVQGLIHARMKGFPINSVTKDKNGKLINKTTVVSVRKIPVSESYFK